MKKFKSISSANRYLHKKKYSGATIGFVPTMGALHEGHLSLIRKSRRENSLTVVSIYVNPTQFSPGEDFRRYPRPIKKDNLLLQLENPDIIIYPSDKEMYPDGFQTSVEVKGLDKGLCGTSRPKHFQGVATVVTKLLNIVTPDRLYLGQKDAQQAVIIQQMIHDLNFPVQVKILPTIREADGLAMSSRNQYLTQTQRLEATELYRALTSAKKSIMSGERNRTNICKNIKKYIENRISGSIEYIACVDAQTLKPLPIIQGKALLALAVRFGNTRLIDNIIVLTE